MLQVNRQGFCFNILGVNISVSSLNLCGETQVALLLAGEACWWTIHPASKQRSEGEKVRVGDDLILVSVSSERYLVRPIIRCPPSKIQTCISCAELDLVLCPQHLSYASGDLMVDASFMQTLWNMNPISSGCELAEGTNLLYTFCSTATNAVHPKQFIQTHVHIYTHTGFKINFFVYQPNGQ